MVGRKSVIWGVVTAATVRVEFNSEMKCCVQKSDIMSVPRSRPSPDRGVVVAVLPPSSSRPPTSNHPPTSSSRGKTTRRAFPASPSPCQTRSGAGSAAQYVRRHHLIGWKGRRRQANGPCLAVPCRLDRSIQPSNSFVLTVHAAVSFGSALILPLIPFGLSDRARRRCRAFAPFAQAFSSPSAAPSDGAAAPAAAFGETVVPPGPPLDRPHPGDAEG